MTAVTSKPADTVGRKLIALLEEARDPANGRGASFGERLDALEIEAFETRAPETTFAMIHVVREAVEFADRLTRKVDRSVSIMAEEPDAADLIHTGAAEADGRSPLKRFLRHLPLRRQQAGFGKADGRARSKANIA